MSENPPIRTYRGSEAPMAMLCPASVNPDPEEILVDSVNPAGIIGTVVHYFCEIIVHTGLIPEHWADVCESHGLDQKQTDDVWFLILEAKSFWDHYKDQIPNPKTEQPHKIEIYPKGHRTFLSCHPDVESLHDGRLIIVDWKGTRLDVNYTAQMQFYATIWILANQDCEVSEVVTILAFLRDHTTNIQVWPPQRLADFYRQYIDQVVLWDGRTYRPGGHCAYCKRCLNCPVQVKTLQQTGQALVAVDESRLPADPNALIDLYEKAKSVEKLLERFHDAVRARVAQSGDSISGSSKRLVLDPQNRDEIDARKAWGILTQWLEDDDLAGATKVSKTAVLRAIGNNAPRGQKAKAKADFMEALREIGAVSTTEFKSLRLMQNAIREVQIEE